MIQILESFASSIRDIPNHITSSQEAAATNFLNGHGTIKDLRFQVVLEHYSPSRMAVMLSPYLTAVIYDPFNTDEFFGRVRQFVEWYGWTSPVKPPYLICELARQIPPDEGYHLPTHEVLGRVFTPSEFVMAIENIAQNDSADTTQFPRIMDAFNVSVQQAMSRQKKNDTSWVFEPHARISLLQSAQSLLDSEKVAMAEKVKLAQAAVSAYMLKDKRKFSDRMVLHSLDLADSDRISQLKPEELAGRFVAVSRIKSEFSAEELLSLIKPIYRYWVLGDHTDMPDPQGSFRNCLACIDQEAYLANQPDPRDEPEIEELDDAASMLLALLFDETVHLNTLRQYSDKAADGPLQLSADKIRETSRLIRAVRLSMLDRRAIPAISNEGVRTHTRQSLHPFINSEPNESAADVAAIEMSITPDGAEGELTPEVLDHLLRDDGILGERASGILTARLEAKDGAALRYFFKRLKKAPLNAHYNLWWQKVGEILQNPARNMVNFWTLDALVDRLAGQEDRQMADVSALAQAAHLASGIVTGLKSREITHDEEGFRMQIQLNSVDCAQNLLTYCINLSSYKIDIIMPLVNFVHDLAEINPAVSKDARVIKLLERVKDIIDLTLPPGRRDSIKQPPSDEEQKLMDTGKIVGVLLATQ